MFWPISRRRLVGALIVVHVAVLCVIPVLSQGNDEAASDAPARSAPAVRENLHLVRQADPFATPSASHVVASESLSLVRTSYRLGAAPARALTQFLEEYIGRPEVFEIHLQEPEMVTIVASPSAQKTIGELIVLIRNAAKDPPGTVKLLPVGGLPDGQSR
jgi:hypothetical protein